MGNLLYNGDLGLYSLYNYHRGLELAAIEKSAVDFTRDHQVDTVIKTVLHNGRACTTRVGS